MSDDTPILSLPMIMPSQAQKHVTHNEALRLLDVIVQLSVTDRIRTAPPAMPVEGDRHIIAAGATGTWAGRDGQIAALWGGTWLFITPLDGWTARVLSESTTVAFQGGLWTDTTAPTTETSMLGINTSADSYNRLSVASDATLLSHVGGGHQVKINKAQPGDTASLLFQSGWQGRAEMGLAGTDSFAVKTSADGSTWSTALATDATTGEVTLPHPLHLGPSTSDPVAPADGTLWLKASTGEVMVTSGGVSAAVRLPDGLHGDIALSGNGSVLTVSDGSVTNAKLATAPANSLKGRGAGSAGNVQDLTPAQARAILDLAPLSHTDFFDLSRFGSSATAVGPFLGAAIASGSNSAAIPADALNGSNPFGTFLRSGATAESGYRYMTTASSDYLGGSRKFRCKCLWRATAGNTVRIGLHNSTNANDTNHGVYFEVLGDQIAAKTSANSQRSQHSTALTLGLNIVYTFDIEADADTARFRVWDGANPVAIMDVTLTTTLPNSNATPFGAGIVATNVNTTSSDLIILYEIGIGTVAGFRRICD